MTMKLVFASDSFKGSLSSTRIGELLEVEAKHAFPDATCVTLPIADGGEGTLAAIQSVRPGSLVEFVAHDGLGNPCRGGFFACEDEAFVEAAFTCGLADVRASERNPLRTTSFGVGECIQAALDHGCNRITVGLGGTCTNDGGMGCLAALGVRFFDANNRELAGCGSDLERVARIDVRGLDPRVRGVAFTVMSDVTNPLTGPYGATRVYGPQKGADAAAVELLEMGMLHFAGMVASLYPNANFATPGFGAAGGLGMALAVFLNARICSGIEELLRWMDFDAIAIGADLIVTGEGQLDAQSLNGKAVGGIAQHARQLGIPVAAICGTVAIGADEARTLGLSRVFETSTGQSLEHALAHAEENYLQAARKLFASLCIKREGPF